MTATSEQQLALIEALEADVVETDKELAEFKWELAHLSDTEAVSASHAARRAELAYRLRRGIDTLESCRAKHMSELERARETVAA